MLLLYYFECAPRCSAHDQRKNYFNIAFVALCGARQTHFHGRGNSLSQSLAALPAPSGREPLAKPETLRLSREVYRHAKGPIPEGAGFASSLREGASGETGNFALEPGSVPPCQRPHPRGGWHRAAMTGGVSSRRGRGRCPCAAERSSPELPKALPCGRAGKTVRF